MSDSVAAATPRGVNIATPLIHRYFAFCEGLGSAVRRLLWGWPPAGRRDKPAPLGRGAFIEGLGQLWQGAIWRRSL